MVSGQSRRSAAWFRALEAVEQLNGSVSHNISLADRRTSFRLDALTWNTLRDIGAREGMSVHQICRLIDDGKPASLSLTMAVRCYVLSYLTEIAGAAQRLSSREIEN